ncbi:MAG: DUF4145 domain-containing protein [Anaerolineae bacterium]|jgi:hypothetical protein|nr:DUF4145 domain-containing protein [Anaerolineae bacterium]
MTDFAKQVLGIAQKIQSEIDEEFKPPVETQKARTSQVIDMTLFKGVKHSLWVVANQINGAYENALYDACAVMIRRLLESLIIECFEYHKIASKIKNSSDDYLYLKELIIAMLNEPIWQGNQGSLGRNVKKALPKLKELGDFSAHDRRFNAYRNDIDNLKSDIRVVFQALIDLANLKNPTS